MMKSIICVLALVACAVLAQPPVLTGFDASLDLYPRTVDNVTGYYHLYWSVVYPDVNFGIVCTRLTNVNMSWCGFGISRTGGMIGSDGAIAFVDSMNNTNAHDYFLAGQYVPTPYPCYSRVCPDEAYNRAPSNCSNNVVSISGYWIQDPSNDSLAYNVVQFSRPLNASDDCDNAITLGTPVKIVYSIGPEANISGPVWPYNINHHIYRGPAPYPEAADTYVTFYEPGSTTATTGTSAVGTTATTAAGSTTKSSTSTSKGSTTGTETAAGQGSLTTESAVIAAIVSVIALFALPFFV